MCEPCKNNANVVTTLDAINNLPSGYDTSGFTLTAGTPPLAPTFNITKPIGSYPYTP